MQTLQIGTATPGKRYRSPQGSTITMVRVHPDNPNTVTIQLDGGQEIDVPTGYMVAELPKPSGVDVASLVGRKPDQVVPHLPKLTDHELDELLAADSRMWVIAAVGDEQERRESESEPAPTEGTCPVCERKRVTVRPSASRGGVLVLASHKHNSGQGVCLGSSHTLADAQDIADAQPEPRRDLDLKKVDNDPVPCDGEHALPNCASPECWHGPVIEAGYIVDEDLRMFPDADPFDGAKTGPDRVAIVKSWGRAHLHGAERLIDTEQIAIQSTVRRELDRQQVRLEQVHGLPATTTKGRDELLRRRALVSTMPGVRAEIDKILAETIIQGGAADAGDKLTERLVGPEDYPESFLAFCATLGIVNDGIERRTIAAMVLSGVRGCREASKACTDEAMVGTAWDYANQQPKGAAIARTLAARHRKLTGQNVEETAPLPTDPVGDLRRLEVGQYNNVHEIEAARSCVRAWIISTADAITEIEPGMLCTTNYETGPYVVRKVRAANGGISLVLRDLRGKTSDAAAYLNELDLVDGHWVRDDTNDRVSFKHHPDAPATTDQDVDSASDTPPAPTKAPAPTEAPEESRKAPVSMARQIEIVHQSNDAEGLRQGRDAASPLVVKAIDDRLIILAAEARAEKAAESKARQLHAEVQKFEADPEPQRPAKIEDLQLVPLPDGTADLWHRVPGGKPVLVGNTAHPQISAIGKQVATYHAEQRSREMQAQPMPTPPLDALGQLGAALAAMKAAGMKATLTIEV